MTPSARPDILWIVTTQWRAQALGSAGDLNARTPRLDALAARSTNYRQAVAPHPFGPFARAALLTGVPSPQNGVREYFDPLPRKARTVAHDLRSAGYVTAFFGKWHLSPRDPKLPLVGDAHARLVVAPEDRGGFEFWEGFEGGFLLNDPWLHGSRLALPRQFPGYQSDVLGERSAGWIEESASRPGTPAWFAMVSLEAPHPPYSASASGIAKYDPEKIELAANVPRGGDVERRARRELAGYYHHIEATDRTIGVLIDRVEAAAKAVGRAAPVVVFTSVHGDMHGAHGLFRKGWPHEESVRVPLLVSVPGRVPRRSDESISLLDLRTLALAWAAGAPEPKIPAAAEISMPSVVCLPDQCDRVWRGFRTSARKLVADGNGKSWLEFDLVKDPGEQTNLATQSGAGQL
jgi:arylsulfatase A-like enzyme